MLRMQTTNNVIATRIWTSKSKVLDVKKEKKEHKIGFIAND
jgi:hypothetical protein